MTFAIVEAVLGANGNHQLVGIDGIEGTQSGNRLESPTTLQRKLCALVDGDRSRDAGRESGRRDDLGWLGFMDACTHLHLIGVRSRWLQSRIGEGGTALPTAGRASRVSAQLREQILHRITGAARTRNRPHGDRRRTARRRIQFKGRRVGADLGPGVKDLRIGRQTVDFSIGSEQQIDAGDFSLVRRQIDGFGPKAVALQRVEPRFPRCRQHVGLDDATLCHSHTDITAPGGSEDRLCQGTIGSTRRIKQLDQACGVGTDRRVRHVDGGIRPRHGCHHTVDLLIAFERKLDAVIGNNVCVIGSALIPGSVLTEAVIPGDQVSFEVVSHLVHRVVGEVIHQELRLLESVSTPLHRIDLEGSRGMIADIVGLNRRWNEGLAWGIEGPRRTRMEVVGPGNTDAKHAAHIGVVGIVGPMGKGKGVSQLVDQNSLGSSVAHSCAAPRLSAGVDSIDVDVGKGVAAGATSGSAQGTVPGQRCGLLTIKGLTRLFQILRLGFDAGRRQIRPWRDHQFREDHILQTAHFQMGDRPLRFQLFKGSCRVITVRLREVLHIEHRHDHPIGSTDQQVGHWCTGCSGIDRHLQAGLNPIRRNHGSETVIKTVLNDTGPIGDGRRQGCGSREVQSQRLTVEVELGGHRR